VLNLPEKQRSVVKKWAISAYQGAKQNDISLSVPAERTDSSILFWVINLWFI